VEYALGASRPQQALSPEIRDAHNGLEASQQAEIQPLIQVILPIHLGGAVGSRDNRKPEKSGRQISDEVRVVDVCVNERDTMTAKDSSERPRFREVTALARFDFGRRDSLSAQPLDKRMTAPAFDQCSDQRRTDRPLATRRESADDGLGSADDARSDDVSDLHIRSQVLRGTLAFGS
jgi:hypothetical protein